MQGPQKVAQTLTMVILWPESMVLSTVSPARVWVEKFARMPAVLSAAVPASVLVSVWLWPGCWGTSPLLWSVPQAARSRHKVRQGMRSLKGWFIAGHLSAPRGEKFPPV